MKTHYMKTPIWIKALAFLRFTVWHDGTEKKFWSYEKALKYKNDILADSEDLTFKGLHVLRGWVGFYIKISTNQPCLSGGRRDWQSGHIACNGWIAEAEK